MTNNAVPIIFEYCYPHSDMKIARRPMHPLGAYFTTFIVMYRYFIYIPCSSIPTILDTMPIITGPTEPPKNPRDGAIIKENNYRED